MNEIVVPTIVTYHSTNNKPEWFAYLKPGGTFLGVRMEGATEAEAVERARAWWVNEKGRQNKLHGAYELDEGDVPSGPYKKKQPDKPVQAWGNSWGTPVTVVAEVHGMAGKVWMLNHAMKHRARVNSGLVSEYEAKGYERGGPKTKFRD